MAFRDIYQRQAALLLRVLPLAGQEDCFALKGGTAINLFVRNMPRLSVDIDLTYVAISSRDESLAAINAAMHRIAQRIGKAIRGARISDSLLQAEGAVVKLLVRSSDVQIKIEVTPVLRGCVYPPEMRSVSPAVEEAFGFAEMPVVSFADLYAGKLVAALDRQNPRDLFDVQGLVAAEGIDDSLRKAFAIYLVSHNRPMAELLGPVRKPIHDEFTRGFDGMTAMPVTVKELEAAREHMIAAIVGDMPADHRRFLISFERGEPDWQMLGLAEARHLPAVLWQQKNLDALSAEARAQLIERLESVLLAPETRPAGSESR
jgi:predicted nucleotidyltransferase component of viral defense system